MIYFESKKIGEGQPCFITFEAGPTHDGLKTAKELVRLAAEACADAVKFQIFDPDRLIADRSQLFSYDVLVDRETGATETVSEPLYDIFCRRALANDEWAELKKYCDTLGLAFFATLGSEEEIRLAESLGCDSIKIASADVNHFPLIRAAAKTGMCIQLDTGSSTLEEISRAIDIIRSQGNERIIIHQCPSGYPARLESINLRIIQTLKDRFPYPAAFSDHSPGWEMDVAAVAMGANLIEKTITLDKTIRSVEHIMSLEPPEMKEFIRAIRNVEVAMGSAERIMTKEEDEKRRQVRRSVFLTEAVSRGKKLGETGVEFKRPGTGLGPDEYESMLDAVFADDLPQGRMLTKADLA